MWTFCGKTAVFQVDTAGLGKYHMGGYSGIGIHRVNTVITDSHSLVNLPVKG